MSTYNRKTVNYRKIYEQYYGSIPQDEQGRSYHIHHRDGDRSNNNPSNLQAVSIEEHYQIHYQQGDWAACLKLAPLLKCTKDELSELARRAALTQINDGTHNFLGGHIQRRTALRRVENGTHNLLGQRNPVHKAVADGTASLRAKEIVRKQLEDGTHPFLDKQRAKERALRRVENGTNPFLGGEIARKTALRRIAEGIHNTLTVHVCPHCGKNGTGPGMFRYHFSRCKLSP